MINNPLLNWFSSLRRDTYLDDLESKSIYIIREAYREYKDKLAILWSMGKDSTTLVHLARKAFFGEIPFSVVHIDTTYKFKQIYDFREKYAHKWKLRLSVVQNDSALAQGVSWKKGRFECCNALKTEALKQAIEAQGYKALLLAIRRDEHGIRAKERYFSPRNKNFKWDYRNQPMELWAEHFQTESSLEAHLRVHPLLHWREIDIWRYILRENLPSVELYFSRNGKRYRSIGCECCCQPVVSKAKRVKEIVKELQKTMISERSGRCQDKEKEYMMQKLRSLGYM